MLSNAERRLRFWNNDTMDYIMICRSNEKCETGHIESYKQEKIEMKNIIYVSLMLVFCSIVNAGSLNPSGAPAPTMKTLDEVEARIPVGQADMPMTISEAGSYYLTGNITSTDSTVIVIMADDVKLDLNGFTVTGKGAGYGVYVYSAHSVEICNGSIKNFAQGIFGVDTSENSEVVVRDCKITANGISGIYLLDNCTIKDCVVSVNGQEATASVYGIRVGANSKVEGCKVLDNGGKAGSSVYGIRVGISSKVVGCEVTGNGYNASGHVKGIYAALECIVRDNISSRNGIAAGTSSSHEIYGYDIGAYSTVINNVSCSNGGNDGSDYTSGKVAGISCGTSCKVSGNNITNNGTRCLSNVYGVVTSYACQIKENIISNNGINAMYYVYGISAADSSSLIENTLRGNGAGAGAGSSNTYSMRAMSVGSGCRIIANNFSDNGTESDGWSNITLYYRGNCIIDQNMFYGNVGTPMTGNSNNTIGTNHVAE